ncbi:MAG: alpha/beta hydrolase-fold protein [Puniceicoccaceae bacterium]
MLYTTRGNHGSSIVLLVAFFVHAQLIAGQEILQEHKRFDSVNGQDIEISDTITSGGFLMDYLLYLPDKYAESREPYPLLLFLHGGGESGTDIEKVKAHGPPRMIEEGHAFPMIVVSPQNSKVKGYWDTNTLIRLLDHLENSYRVDTNRIYLTGLSRGGFGAWCLAIENPDRFAALVPISGAAPAPYADWLGGIPTWVFHGALDTVIPPSESLEMVEEMQNEGGNVRFTLYPDAGHDAWTETYADPELWQWLMRQQKTAPGVETPNQYDPPFVNKPWQGRPYPSVQNPIPSMGGFRHTVLYSRLHEKGIGYSIVLPKTYFDDDSSTTRFPVIYFLHGLTGSETADFWNSRYYFQETEKGSFPEVIMVFPNGMNEGYVDNPNGELFIESHIITELVPHINQEYRTAKDCVGIVGFSMGAGGAVRYVLKYPELFNYAVAIDGSRYYFSSEPSSRQTGELSGTQDPLSGNTIPELLEIYDNKTRNLEGRSAVMILTGEKRKPIALELFQELQEHGVPCRLISDSLDHDATLFYDKYLEEILWFEKNNLCN